MMRLALPPAALATAALLLLGCNDEQVRNGLPFIVEGKVGDGPTLVIPTGDLVPNPADGRWFGTQTLGTEAVATFTIRNLTNQPISFPDGQPVVISSGDFTAFSVINQPPQEISGGATATFQLRFQPAYERTANAVVSITYIRAQGRIFSMGVAGRGSDPANEPQPRLSVVRLDTGVELSDNGTLPTGTVAFGDASSYSLELVNSGNGLRPLEIISVIIDGANKADFAISPAAPSATLPSGETLPLTLTFQPNLPGHSNSPSSTAPEARRARMTIRSSARDADFVLELQGQYLSQTPPQPTSN